MSVQVFELAAENIGGYLARRGLIATEREVTARELGGGVSNIVLMVELPGRRWVVKQSLDKLRVKDDWRSDRARIFREAEAIQMLGSVLGETALPKVIHVDHENFLFIMTAAPAGSVIWKESLLTGRQSDPTVAHQAGVLLSRIINTSRTDPSFQKRFWDGTVFDQLRIDPYYRTTALRHPDVREEFKDLIGAGWNVETALVHGDYSPKNMMVTGGKIFLIDFEVVHWGDPSFDAGFLLNHLLLKTLYQPRFRDTYIHAAREFWKTLLAGLGTGDRDFERRTLRHLGGLMLARIDGKSPVEYIRDEETKERIRRVAKRVLFEKPQHLEEALGLVLGELR